MKPNPQSPLDNLSQPFKLPVETSIEPAWPVLVLQGPPASDAPVGPASGRLVTTSNGVEPPLPPVLSVLVIEDSVVVRKRLCALLEEAGRIQVVGEAASAFEGWFLFRQWQPDAVVLDMHLPVISGMAVLRRIKAVAPECPVIMFSNLADPHSRAECRRSGADYFLHKAREFDQVVTVLNQCRRQLCPPVPSGKW